MTGAADIKDRIRAEAFALGFDSAGFAAAAPDPRLRERLELFLGEGQHGDMGWLEANADRRADPQTLWPEALTVLSLGLNYGPAEDPLPLLEQRERGVISVYARGRDYHDVVKKKLKALGGWIHRTFKTELKVFVDTAPVMEKPLAMRAGIGWQGKHTNLVSRDWGSWARSTWRSTCRRTRRSAIAAAPAGPASTSARPRPSRRPTGSTPGAASPT
jgi:epoxyqueuosine reductase